MTAPDRYDLLVRGGTLVTDAGRRRADVGVAGGTIAAIGQFDGEAVSYTHLTLPTICSV